MEGMAPEPRSVRSDAARNHRQLLDAAMELVVSGGADALTMDELARRACVGKGTVFRRFGSRAGLMQAVLDRAEQDFRAAYLSGPPPLGPGAGPAARLLAFGLARLASLELNGELVRAAEPDHRSRYFHPARQEAQRHLAQLLAGAGTVPDPELAAYQLLAFLDAGLFLHLRRDSGMDTGRLEKGWQDLVSALLRD